MQLLGAFLGPSLKNKKKSTPKNVLISCKIELFRSNVKKFQEMEARPPKKFFAFQETVSHIFFKESFFYISRYRTLHFPAQAQKVKKKHPKKISYNSGNRNPPKNLYVLKRKHFLYFWKWKY